MFNFKTLFLKLSDFSFSLSKFKAFHDLKKDDVVYFARFSLKRKWIQNKIQTVDCLTPRRRNGVTISMNNGQRFINIPGKFVNDSIYVSQNFAVSTNQKKLKKKVDKLLGI